MRGGDHSAEQIIVFMQTFEMSPKGVMTARAWLDSIMVGCDPGWKNAVGQTFTEFCRVNPWWGPDDFL